MLNPGKHLLSGEFALYSFFQQRFCLSGHNDFLIGIYDINPHLAVGSGNIITTAGVFILVRIQLYAEALQPFQRHCPDTVTFAANTATKHDGIHAAHGGSIGTDVLFDTVGIGFQSVPAVLIAVVRMFEAAVKYFKG